MRPPAREEVVAGDTADWQAFVGVHPAALPYHHASWAATLADAYGFEPKAFVLHAAGGGILGGIPFVELGGRLRPRRWVALPFTDVCPPLSESAAGADVAARLVACAHEAGVGLLEIHAPVEAPGAYGYARGFVHELRLGDPEALFRAFRPQVRRNIRKAQRCGVVVREGARRSDLTRVYFDLHAATRRRLGVPPQPRRFFEALWRHVVEPGLGFLLLAEHGGEPVAGALFLDWNGRVVYKYGASDARRWPVRPNNLLFWECILRACAEGAHTLDLGRTDLDDHGLREFKRGWGAAERPLAYTVFGRATEPAQHSGRILRTVLRLAPAPLGRAIGTALYRFAA